MEAFLYGGAWDGFFFQPLLPEAKRAKQTCANSFGEQILLPAELNELDHHQFHQSLLL